MIAAGLCRCRQSWRPGRATLSESPLYFVPQSWAAGCSCLSAVTGEAAERVRGGADRVRVGAGRCRSHNAIAESDGSADQYFRNHLTVFRRHFILFPRNKAVLRLDTENNAPGVRIIHRRCISDVLSYFIIARQAAGVATADTHQYPPLAGISDPQLACISATPGRHRTIRLDAKADTAILQATKESQHN
jgi:hypothetical protein